MERGMWLLALGQEPFTKLVLSKTCSELEFMPEQKFDCHPWKRKIHVQMFPTVGEKYSWERTGFVLKYSKGN